MGISGWPLIFALGLGGSVGQAAAEVSVQGPSREYHVSTDGDDAGEGSARHPLRTISAAANLAQPGDSIIVHEGIYREWIRPPRGGESESRRIVYEAAAGETVEIKGSEIVKDWKKVVRDTWTVTIPNEFFGEYNPYREVIRGDWFNPRGRDHHTGAVYLNGKWLTEAASLDEVLAEAGETPLWFGRAGRETTRIWAQFKGSDPNREQVEINVRRAVFYPEKTGVNYLTVRGFIMRNAATQWAPPTAEQIGLVGTHWSRGWIIENNVISHSKCTGITLGKYGDEWDNTSENTAEGYVQTIQRALQRGWSGDAVGHHIVRNNTISHCQQAGIAGSLGGIFSVISGNTIHDIHVNSLFSGAEMAGIKIHAAIDVLIGHNRIFRTDRGIWLDWMAQGARVSANLLYDNWRDDLFVEVNHGPFLVDNNLFLSEGSLLNVSEGGAYVHNLFAGQIRLRPELKRSTPFHKEHSTEIVGLRNIEGGDDRFYNNIFVARAGLSGYDEAAQPVWMSGNVFLNGARPSRQEELPLQQGDFDPLLELISKADEVSLEIALQKAWGAGERCRLVTTELLGEARIPALPYVRPDGRPLRVDSDYFGKPRNENGPFPGPFELPAGGQEKLRVWPTPIHPTAETSKSINSP